MLLKYRYQFLVLASVFLVLGLSYQTYAQQTPIVWSPPLLLGDGWWNNVTTDRTGTAHVSWYSGIRTTINTINGEEELDNDLFMYTRRTPDGVWTEPRDIIYTGYGGYTIRNALGVTSQGRIHAYFRSQTELVYSQAPAQTAENPAAWETPLRFLSGYYLDLLVDKTDVVHIASSGEGEKLSNESEVALAQGSGLEDCTLCYDLYYYRSDDDGLNWSFPVKLNITKHGADKIDVWQGAASGRIYVSWSGGQDWYRGRNGKRDGRLVYSNDDGVTWSDEIILTGAENTRYEVTQLAVTEMADERLMAVWHYATINDNRIYYQISDDVGASWSEPEVIPNIYRRELESSILDHYSLLTDKSGIVHLMAVGSLEPGAPASVFHLEYRQEQWRTPSTVFVGSTEERPEWPQAAIGPQNDIHLTWFIRLPMTNAGVRPLKVYYSHRTETLPDEPLLAYVPTTAPTAVAAQALRPTATPFPTVAPFETATVTTTSDLYAIQTLLSGAFVVFLLCGVVLLAVGFRPRR